MRKIVIFGGCASRDVFRIVESTNFELKEYTARTTLASQFSRRGVSIKKSQISKLGSGFQQKMVLRDFSKNYFDTIKDYNFDYLLMDFLIERSRLLLLSTGEILTYSKELQNTKFISSLSDKGRLISPNSEERLRLWMQGWDAFVEVASSLGMFDKIVINKLYWAKIDEKDRAISSYSPYSDELIDSSNQYLSKIYDYCAKDIKLSNFLTYENKDFIANSKHEWGPSPFHYVDSFYYLTEKKLLSV